MSMFGLQEINTEGPWQSLLQWLKPFFVPIDEKNKMFHSQKEEIHIALLYS
jgi:hypothetical protein